MIRTILLLAVAGLMLIALTGRVWAYSEDDEDTLLGKGAGAVLQAGNFQDTFIGAAAGYKNTTGSYNSFIGYSAGWYNTTGSNNSFIGADAGVVNTTGNDNSFVGTSAGYNNTTGYQNSFIL